MKKILIAMLMILQTACSCFKAPVGDFCEVYQMPSPDLSKTNPELANKLASDALGYAASIKTNRDRYKEHCE